MLSQPTHARLVMGTAQNIGRSEQIANLLGSFPNAHSKADADARAGLEAALEVALILKESACILVLRFVASWPTGP